MEGIAVIATELVISRPFILRSMSSGEQGALWIPAEPDRSASARGTEDW